MKGIALLCLTVAGSACLLAGCNVGEVSADQQQAKAKAMDEIAKKDPNYAAKRAAHGGGRN